MAFVARNDIDNVAVLSIDHPPVNALGAELRAALAVHLEAIAAEDATIGIVIASGQRMFSAGADIRELGRASRPSLPDVLRIMDASPKPIVAAIDGSALGGGLELALACDARVATPNAGLGLPEVKLGLLPGAGGTQRLPRLTGPLEALEMTLDGEPRAGDAALRLALVDEVVECEHLLAAAASAVRRLAGGGEGRLRLSQKALSAGNRDEFERRAAVALAARPHEPQVKAIISCIRAAFDLPFSQGESLERKLFLELLESSESKALRHAFLSERKVARAHHTAGRPVRQADRVTVIGGGTMGTGIAVTFLDAGNPVTIVETNREAAERAQARIHETYRSAVRRNRLSLPQMSERLSRLEVETSLASAADAELIIEAAFEDMAIKRQIAAEVASLAKIGAVIATNTSYLDINDIAAATNRPEDFLGMHFFSPASVMKLVEIVRGRHTSDDTLEVALHTSRRIGKIPVVVGVCHGFVGNRMLSRRSAQVDRLLIEGATPAEIDAVLTDFGFRMGPCAMSDLAGLDISWSMRKSVGIEAPAADALCKAGRFGQKTGHGYYRYVDGERNGRPDATAIALIAQAAARAGVEPRAHTPGEILARLLYPLINEGARILEEEIAASPSDIDVVWLHGYNWPRWRGGPMFFANQIGLGSIVDELQRFSREQNDPGLAPAELLMRLVSQGGGFPL